MAINSSSVGSAAEFAVAVAAMEYGFPVSQPLGCYAHYDLIVDVNHTLIKVQVKSIFKNRGGFNCASSRTIRNRSRYETIKYSAHDFDFAALYLKEKKEIFIVPFDVFTFSKTFYLSKKGHTLYKDAWHLLEEFAAPKTDRRQCPAFNPVNERFNSFWGRFGVE